MPGDLLNINGTTHADLSENNGLERRQKGQKVQNGGLVNYNNRNIKDGVGGGSDSYTMYWGD